MDQATSDQNSARHNIQQAEVLLAWRQVKKKGGGPGIDGQTIAEFESNLNNNLYVIWNQMCAGSYFPSEVKRVDIPKPDGSKRPLGIPSVADRVAQTVIKNRLEPYLEPHFQASSYGCRPGKSAIQAVQSCRRNCWTHDWGVDLDIKGYFDHISHELMMQALRLFTGGDKVILLYCERWLKASVRMPDGTSQQMTKGTPQGGVISPLLANLFLHCVNDWWMKNRHPSIPFERYMDDIIYHCNNSHQAEYLLYEIRKRMGQCHLELHPTKTRIFYCKDDNRTGDYDITSFDFLGYTFKPRTTATRAGSIFLGFNPAVSRKAKNKMAGRLKAMKIHRWTRMELTEIAELLNPILVGWINYYGAFQPSRVIGALQHLVDNKLKRWAKRKYKRLKRSWRKASGWISYIRFKYRRLFAHWCLVG